MRERDDPAQRRQAFAVKYCARTLWLSVLQRGTAAFHAPRPMVEPIPPAETVATVLVPYSSDNYI